MDEKEKNMYFIAFSAFYAILNPAQPVRRLFMNDYLINTAELNRIFELLNRVLKIRITFFDLQSEEINILNIKERSAFCRHWRRQKEFNALCEECDRKNLEICKKKRSVHVYHCHAGLLESIVPLYNRDGAYLGAIVLGQLRDAERQLDEKFAGWEKKLQSSTVNDMYNTGTLLKYLSEYICENELIKRCSRPWSNRVAEFVEARLTQPVTLQELARAVGCSPSFLSHNIPVEFGMTFKQYVRQKRMTRAAKLLAEGKLVRECAFLLGYKDEFYFSRDFKKFFGTAPKYRKKSETVAHCAPDIPVVSSRRG